VLLGYEEEQRRRAFEALHPEYRGKVSEWMAAEDRWVREGGRRPKPPRFDYEDYPCETGRWTWVDSLPGSRLGNFLGRMDALSARVRGKQQET
jgi:hypothetical protein